MFSSFGWVDKSNYLDNYPNLPSFHTSTLTLLRKRNGQVTLPKLEKSEEYKSLLFSTSFEIKRTEILKLSSNFYINTFNWTFVPSNYKNLIIF